MIKNQLLLNTYNITLVLFCLANLLELFIPRMDEGNYFIRMPIQLINGGLLLLMWSDLLHRKNNWTPVTKVILLFILLIIVYSVVYVMQPKFSVSDFAPYIKLLLWTSSLIFFYEMMLEHGINYKLMNVYIFTFVLAVAKKIFETSLFESETLGAGDTASLPLLFIIPVILMCLNDKLKYLFIAVVSILILVSLRRTAILGLALCFPFIYKYISNNLKAYHILLLGIVFTAGIVLTWGYIGEAVIFRFENLLVGDAGGNKDSFGSGRSDFYLTVWNGWLDNGLPSILYGNGLNSAEQLLMRVNNIKHAHNDYLQIAYTFGIIGIGIWLTFIQRLWKLRKQIALYKPEYKSIHYVCIISYLIIGLASGCILRITTMPFALTVAILLYQVQAGKLLIQQELKESEPARSAFGRFAPA